MEVMVLDKKTSQTIQHYLPQSDVCAEIAGFFAAFADTTRIKILSALSFAPLCVSDLCAVTDINQTTASHQLKFLKTAGLVRAERQGKIVFYELIAANALNDLMIIAADRVFG